MAYFNRYRGNKYGNTKINGYDSKAEARRGRELEALEAAGEICGLRRQVKFSLIPAQYEYNGVYLRGPLKGEPKRGKLIERECAYYADFVYTDKDGETIVEDVKGFETDSFKIKKKLMLYVYGIRVQTIKGGRNGR